MSPQSLSTRDATATSSWPSRARSSGSYIVVAFATVLDAVEWFDGRTRVGGWAADGANTQQWRWIRGGVGTGNCGGVVDANGLSDRRQGDTYDVPGSPSRLDGGLELVRRLENSNEVNAREERDRQVHRREDRRRRDGSERTAASVFHPPRCARDDGSASSDTPQP